MKAAFLDFATVTSPTLDLSALTRVTPILDRYDSTPPDAVADRIEGCEFVFVNKVRLTREIIADAQSLRFIGLVATGTDNVDLDAAREHGVAVCNIRGYCTRSVAEHVFATLLQLTRSVDRYDRCARRGDWRSADNFCLLDHPIRELAAMSIGIVGYGELGRAVADLAEAFRMRVIVSRRPGESGSVADGRLDLDDLLRASDVVSLHCPLTDETRGLIGKRELGLMKPDSILINTARGALVDASALADALATGEIGAAAIDVLATEPPTDGNPLLDYDGDNLVLTPHVAWASNESRQRAVDELAANVAAFLEGGRRNRVD